MTLAVEFSEADADFIEKQANAADLSVELFARDAIIKAAHNAAYIEKLNRADDELKEGKFKTFTAEEWEKFVNEQDI